MVRERRKVIRVRFNGKAWFRQGNDTYQRVQLLDLAEGGTAVGLGGLESGTEVELVLKPRPGRYIDLKGRVVSQKDGRVGISFRPSARNKITHFLATEVSVQLTRCLARSMRPPLQALSA